MPATNTPLFFVSLGLPERAIDLSETARQQLIMYGESCDGRWLPAEERLEGEHALYGLGRWAAVDAGGGAAFDLWLSNVDCGAVFRAGSTELVGLIVQGGFACTDLAAWEQLADANRAAGPRAALRVDFSLDEEAGPLIYVAPPALCEALVATPGRSRELLGAPAARVESAWRALRLVATPWDGDGALIRLLTASGPATLPGVRSQYGAPLAYFPPDSLGPVAAAIAALPPDAVARRAAALEAAIDEPAYRELSWLRDTLGAIGDAVRRAAGAGAGLIVS
jgi:hypothetical protein